MITLAIQLLPIDYYWSVLWPFFLLFFLLFPTSRRTRLLALFPAALFTTTVLLLVHTVYTPGFMPVRSAFCVIDKF